jgi:GT2 family glycosyltransferase
MSDSRAPVAVIVVSWNSIRYLGDCLDSLERLTCPPAEICVVDNGSTDGSPDAARGRTAVRLVALAENVGFCRANNLGIQQTTSPFVLVLNPDTVLRPDFLEQLLPAFEDPRVGMAAGKLLRFDGETLDSCGQLLGRSRQPVDRGYGQPDRGQMETDGEVFGVCGAAALYRRQMLDSIADPGRQYFDERFFAFYEDLDLAWRARRRGWTAMYRHRAVGRHARGGSAEGSSWLSGRAAMLGRPAEIRFHVVKNRYLTILRNDRPGDYLRNLPFIWGRDLATLALLVAGSPGVLARLWRARALFPEAVRRGRLDAGRSGHQLDLGPES